MTSSNPPDERKYDVPVPDECALRQFLLSAEPKNLRLHFGAKFCAGRVVSIQDRKVGWLLILKNAGFCIDIGTESPVTVKVVWGHVENNCDFGMEALDRLELKAGDLQHHGGFGCRTFNQRNGRRADVSANYSRTSGRGDNFARQSGGRCLAVRPRDGNDRAGEEPRCQFDLADYRLTSRPRLNQGRCIYRNAGTNHDQILFPESAFPMSARFDDDAMVEQKRDLWLSWACVLASVTVTVAHAPSEIAPRPRPTSPVQPPEPAC